MTSIPAQGRADLPQIQARVELVESLGGESMAYFKVDARQIKSEAPAVDEIAAAGDEHEESVVGSRPNLVASFPPHVQLASATTSASPSTRATCTSSTKHRVRRFVSCAIAASPRSRSVAPARVATAGPPTGAQLRALSQLPTQSSLGVAADLLRHARPVRERVDGERHRRPDRPAHEDRASTRPTRPSTTAATCRGSPATCSGSRTSASPRSG